MQRMFQKSIKVHILNSTTFTAEGRFIVEANLINHCSGSEEQKHIPT